MEKYEQVKEGRVQIFINNFVGGIAWALGATFGLGLIIALLTVLLRNISLVPIVGNFVESVIEFIIVKNPNLLVK